MRTLLVKNAALALFLLTMSACGGSDAPKTNETASVEVKKDMTADGKLQEEYEFDKARGLKNGKSKIFFDDGKVMIEQNYKLGKLDGKQTTYHPNGKVKSEISFIEDRQNGAFVFYHDNGTKYQEGTYKESAIEGVLKTYYPNGKLKESVTLVNGAENGAFEEYSEAGIISAKGNYVADEEGNAKEQGILEEYDETGKLIAKKDCEMGVCYKIWDIEKGDIKPNKMPK
jgi:antitoxin component YwqK of YwqJK toxin-antitoxin module